MLNAAHRLRLFSAALVISMAIIATVRFGADYYMMDMQQRVLSEKHRLLRPSGLIGLKLGMAGVALFFCLYLYPIRKRWQWLQRFGKTKHWLDFHVLFGVTAPLVITLHSSFKLHGIAGVAYWLMMAVMWSGFVGRYFYAQIPRTLNTTVMSLGDLAKLSGSLRGEIEAQSIFSQSELQRVFASPDAAAVEQMSLAKVLPLMVWLDISRPFRVAALRRRDMPFTEKLQTLGGLLPSSNHKLENAVRLVRQESWLLAKMTFLGKAHQVFQLWHVIHRPFSYSFAVLALIHIALVLAMGYY